MPIGIRPSTLRKLRQKQSAKVSHLHISIAGFSYLKDQQQQVAEAKETDHPYYTIIKRGKINVRN
jgi:hypothetical protein